MHKSTLEAIIEPIVTTLGFEFVGYEILQQGHAQLIRVYIDAEQGINIDHCTQVSRQISAVFDVEDPITGNYYLEVSSPGSDRPLFKPAHYERFLGQKIRMRTRSVQEAGRRRFTGILKAVEHDTIQLLLDDSDSLLTFSFDEIEKANLYPDIKTRKKK